MRQIALATLGLALIASAAAAQDKATIQKRNDQWAAAFNKGDAAAVAALYTEDADVLPPGNDMVSGRKEIEIFWSEAVRGFGDAQLTTVSVVPLGTDAAREIGTFKFMTKGTAPHQITGKYVVFWRKVGNDWQLATDIWNSNR